MTDQRQSEYFTNCGCTVRKGGKLPEIILAWNKKQDDLKKQGLQDK